MGDGDDVGVDGVVGGDGDDDDDDGDEDGDGDEDDGDGDDQTEMPQVAAAAHWSNLSRNY